VDATTENPDRQLIAEVLAAGRTDVPLDASPVLRALSARLLKGSPGDLSLSFVAGPATQQGNGVVSGGALATMLDTAIALAVLSQLSPGQTCSTISITINMMRPARNGKVQARGTVDRLGRRVAFASARLLDEEERLIAIATSSLAISGAAAAD